MVGYRPLGRKESDTTERLHFHFSLSELIDHLDLFNEYSLSNS